MYVRPLNSGEKGGGERRKKGSVKQKRQGTWESLIRQPSRAQGGGRRALVGERRVRKRQNKGIEPENARRERWREANGGGRAQSA